MHAKHDGISLVVLALFTLAGALPSGAAHAAEKAQKKSEEAAPEETAPEDKPAEAEEPAADESGDSITRGLSWDVLGGGVPTAGAVGQLEIGFSGLPRVAYHYTTSPSLSIGGMVSFDYAYWAPHFAFAPTLLLQVPVRYSLAHNDSITLGLRADPGLGFFFKGPNTNAFTVGLLLNMSGSIGFSLQNRMIVGGGIELPMVLGASGDGAFLRFPILFGPFLEFHATPPLAMTFDLKVGPHLTTGQDTVFGLRLMAGVAYRM